MKTILKLGNDKTGTICIEFELLSAESDMYNDIMYNPIVTIISTGVSTDRKKRVIKQEVDLKDIQLLARNIINLTFNNADYPGQLMLSEYEA